MQSTAVATSPATISAFLGGYLGSLFAQRMLSFMSAWTSDIACTVHLPSREYRSAANEDDANEGGGGSARFGGGAFAAASLIAFTMRE
jgi:hypothetical protein